MMLEMMSEVTALVNCCSPIIWVLSAAIYSREKSKRPWFAAGGQTKNSLLLKVVLICLPMFLHCGSMINSRYLI